MQKYKIVRNRGTTQLVIKGQKGQQLSEREAYAINNNLISGLTHFEIIRKGMSFELVYNLTGFNTLQAYLTLPLNKARFVTLLKNILDGLSNAQQAYFNTQRIIFEFDKVLMSPHDNKLFFIYVPIQGYDTETSLRDFLLNIIKKATFAPGEDRDYIKQYIRILNSGINFSVFDLEEYIRSLSDEGGSKSTKETKCPKCGFQLSADTNFCPRCGLKMGNAATPNHGGNQVYNPLSGVKATQQKPVLKPYLLQSSTGMKWPLEQAEVLVGKDQQFVDVVIVNNPAISRRHAKVVRRDEKCFVVDLKSTNRTFVNGYPIPANAEVELKVNDRILFANEEFVYGLD